jgi:type I restriction enzyme S subunit
MSWEKVKLENLCKMNSGGTPSRSNISYYSGDIPWAKISDIEAAEGGVIYNTEEKITIDGLASINNRVFEKGTLLLAMYGSVGKVAFAGLKMSTNQAILGIRIIDEKVLDYSYLKYWFQTIKNKLLDRAVGGTLQNISLGIVKDLEIPLPPLSVQKRIAEILDAANALRRKDQELLKKYDELAQSIFIELFGDPVKNEKGWEVKRLDDLLLEGEKISYGVVQPGDDFPNGVPIVRVGDFNLMRIDKTNLKRINPEIEKNYNRTRLKGDEILIACVGSIGKIALADDSLQGFNIVRATAKVRVDKERINRKYLAFHLSQKSIQNYFIAETRTSSQPTLNIKQIEETKILIPPIEIQNHFDLLSDDLLKQIEMIHQSNSNGLFQSLLQQAFKGELVQ